MNQVMKNGLYYIETDNTMPMRGNGWYSVALTKYCIDNHIINLSDIKYVVYSALTIPKDYFNHFIMYILTLNNMQRLLLIL